MKIFALQTLILFLLLPLVNYSQPIDEHLLSTEEELQLSGIHNTNRDINFSPNSVGDDLLRASRLDKWMEDAWESQDSVEHYYNENDLRSEVITRILMDDEWVLSSRRIYEYDDNNNKTLELDQSWNLNEWVDSLQRIYQYDGNANRILELHQFWNLDEWINNTQFIAQFDSNNNRTQNVKQSWNMGVWMDVHRIFAEYDNDSNITSGYSMNLGSDGITWQYYPKRLFEYDQNGNLIHRISQFGDDINGWDNAHRFSYEYDDNGNNILKFSYNWLDENWTLASQYIYEYDIDNKLTYGLEQDLENDEWIDKAQDLYTYDGDNLITLKHQEWHFYEWVNNFEVLYEYDDNRVSREARNWINGEWVGIQKRISEYDDNNNLVLYFIQDWVDDEWVDSLRFIYYYDIVSSSLFNPGIQDFTLHVYPNPTNSITTIHLNDDPLTQGKLQVFNNVGQLIMTQVIAKGEHKKELQVEELPKGLYTISIEIGSKRGISNLFVY